MTYKSIFFQVTEKSEIGRKNTEVKTMQFSFEQLLTKKKVAEISFFHSIPATRFRNKEGLFDH
jgi:hypothetical protein